MSSDLTITFVVVLKGARLMSQPLDGGQPVVETIIEDPVVLTIPKSRLDALCLHPVKYLRFLAWAILMLPGTIQLADTSEDLPDDFPLDSLLPAAEYIFVPRPPSSFGDARTFDPTTLGRQGEGSATTESRKRNFSDKLRERDGRCIFTGFLSFEAAHIVPFQRGSEWLQKLIRSRLQSESPSYSCDEPGHEVDDPIATLRDIDDKRNGFLCAPHGLYDDGSWAIMHTPNHILTVEDIPKSDQRALFPPQTLPKPSGAGYQRFTAQWLINPSDVHLFEMRDNTDAAFANHRMQKPSAFLLDCAYGAAALRQWGVGVDSALRIFPEHLPRPKPIEHLNMCQSRPEYSTTAEDRASRRRNDGDDHRSVRSDDTVVDGTDKFDVMYSVLTRLYNAGLGKRGEPPDAKVTRWLDTAGAGI
ncbi:uncharacterized protein STEHIDRAFT_139646 [Stereum hirsutum FP-91666 SS1]|uniref:uncharacterized protein n=1 Tax=Stereum hirsutum (strain FP-91666) TaxID=721885 RepID=UPI0004449F22|nr:uncharacterized protein STEHIDRAFT_139646 [Stereum hirsutum FP-91666 SS1]EIM85736.1 hypothetical protein STEHIDRAFT_139646 [Stereum hirsutum FP-91666 SS1]